jgi:hypothetical protein
MVLDTLECEPWETMGNHLPGTKFITGGDGRRLGLGDLWKITYIFMKKTNMQHIFI